jgi:hypothetical protein
MPAFSDNHKLPTHKEQKVLPNSDRNDRVDLSKGRNRSQSTHLTWGTQDVEISNAGYLLRDQQAGETDEVLPTKQYVTNCFYT